MRCIICDESAEKNHIFEAHIQPLNVTKEEVLKYAKNVARPLQLKETKYVTGIRVAHGIIQFFTENAILHAAFAREWYGLNWKAIVEWTILHEKGHLVCRNATVSSTPAARSSAEDYYINKYLIPDKYRLVIVSAGKSMAELGL